MNVRPSWHAKVYEFYVYLRCVLVASWFRKTDSFEVWLMTFAIVV